jgi:ABC-type multidrug transport system fused ATPase/permease subunit
MKKLPFVDFDARFLRYFAHHGLLLAATLFVMVASTLLGLVAPWPMKYIVDNVIGQQPFKDPLGKLLVQWIGTNQQAQVLGFGLVMMALTAVSALFDFAESYLETLVQERATFQLRSDVFAHIQSLSMQFHDRMRTGELINRVSKDTDRIISGLLSSMGDVLTSIVKFIGLVATMLFLSWRLSLIAFAYMPLFILTFSILRKRTKIFARIARQEEGFLFATAQEILANIRIVKAFGRQTYEQNRFNQHGVALMAADLRAERWEVSFSVFIDLLKSTAVVVTVWYGVTQIIAQQLTVGELLIFLSYLGSIYGPVKKFSSVIGSLQKTAVSAERIAELFDDPAILENPIQADGLPAPSLGHRLATYSSVAALTPQPEYLRLAMHNHLPPAKVMAGKVEFAGVTFHYANKKRRALRDISFVAYPGQKIGVVGATGAGKTTICNLLMRFYEPTQGSILIDGVELRQIPLADWCQQVALVTQEAFLFAAPICDNIAYGRPNATLHEIMQAAKIANAHEFIVQLPEQYQTIIGERGATLSGGQRQRLALARAVLCDTPILILDEPTAGLDTIAEHNVMEAIENVTSNRTTFIITHRLATIRNADLIIVIEDGQIIERGRHEELMAFYGKYNQLWTIQDEPTAMSNGLARHVAR